MKAKHRNDKKHGKGGFVSGNARYSRKNATTKMGRARSSRC